MKTPFIILYSIYLLSQRAFGIKVGFYRRAEFKPIESLASGDGADADNNTDTIFDIQYTTNITLNGKSVRVVLDTENPDLWILPSSDIGNFNDTKIPAEIDFADDTNKVSGTIGVSKFEFGNHTVERQAFLYASQSSSTISQFPKLGGIHGSFGLGFSLEKVSPVNQAIKKQFGENATWGQTVLSNIFQAFPDRPNFIGFDLARLQSDTSDHGSFTIGEYDPEYPSISSAPKLAQFPQSAGRWSTLVDGIVVNGKSMNLTSTNRDTPSGRTIALFSTTSVKNVFPKALGDQIYGAVEGAVKYESDGKSIWIVPCDATPEMQLGFGGQNFSIHPLDMSVVETDVLPNGKNYTACIATYLEDEDRGEGAYDIVLGNTFLRNVYSIYDFGDEKGGFITEPYIQLVSKIDFEKAVTEFQQVRPEELKGFEAPLAPEDLVKILKDNEDKSGFAPAGSSDSDSTDSNSKSEGGLRLGKYGPTVIGLLAANLIFLIVVLAFLVLNFVRRGKAVVGKKGKRGGGEAFQLQSQKARYTKIQDEEGP